MEKLIINDLHIGVQRVAGATPATAFSLRAHALSQLSSLVKEHGKGRHVIVNGDLFDGFMVPLGDMLATYEIFADWFNRGDGTRLTLLRGNHDISKDSSQISIFDLFGRLLLANYPHAVDVFNEPGMIEPSLYALPHCRNQEIFDLELKKAETLPSGTIVLLHANYDNKFAVESDHSLNVSAEQAERLTGRGLKLVFGHEHQARDFPNIVIVGNQFPTSVADCLGNDYKRAVVVDEAGEMTEVETWNAEGSFRRIDWRDINGEVIDGEFIRVEGVATAEEASQVVQVVSKLRQKSDAFVVTNAVKIDTGEDLGDLDVAVQDMKAVNVLDYLFEQLDTRQVEVVKKLLETADAD